MADELGGVRAVHLAAAAGLAVAGVLVSLATEVDQRVASRGGLEDHRRAIAAVAAIRSAPGDVLLATEGDLPLAAAARAHVDDDLV